MTQQNDTPAQKESEEHTHAGDVEHTSANHTMNRPHETKKRPWLIALVTLLALLALIAAVLFVKSGIKAKHAEKKTAKPEIIKPTVEFIVLKPESYASRVVGFGEAKARYSSPLNANVSGKVAYVAESFAAGKRVRKGQLLIQLDKDNFASQVASQESALASAELNLLEEQRKQKQARYEWQASGLSGQPESPLFYRGPQIKSAKAAIADAKLRLQKSRDDLKDTAIRSPFDAVITQINVQPGSVIQAGATLATLNSTDRVEIAVPLSAEQWSQLPSSNILMSGKWPVQLATDDGSQTWRGYVIRLGKSVNAQTRQRELIVAVERPYDLKNPLYAGSFVKASIDGKVLSNMWKIPATSISQAGDIWLIDDNDCLIRMPLKENYSRDGALYMSVPEYQTHARLVLSPLNSFVAGMCVTPEALSIEEALPQAEQLPMSTEPNEGSES